MTAPPCKRLKTAEATVNRRVIFDVSGTIVKISREMLGYLGRCEFLERMDDVETDEAVELSYPLSIFDEFHCALVAARRDTSAAMKMLNIALESPRGIVLKELLDYLGYDWLLGKQFEAPLALKKAGRFTQDRPGGREGLINDPVSVFGNDLPKLLYLSAFLETT